ncbi:hypothetical protein [Sphingomonas baiyangensis]|uniref:Uncharacterized protein n=1 Tax=Sphingomonas baiyangensis TaxID=2572576 RepID=A0A4V6WRE6_9SPHN|nr:hypothetical protein [Sphingomonas baiyangensis]TKD50028.1 hypothetical protein FBR43_04105 [Sphingomonas baiyangensis]
MLRCPKSAVALLALIPLVAGCAREAPEVAVVVPPPAPPAAPAPMPRPPMGAAATLTLPQPAPDGSFVTPNRALSAAATAWHLRAALNVAVLQCARPGDPMEAGYNQFLKAHKTALASAHSTLAREYRAAHGAQAQDAFDDAMTRLYNFYAQPPARSGFCAAAAPLVAQAAALPADGLADFAAPTLAALDVPFTDFYRAYAQYRQDLAAWHAGRSKPVMVAAVAAPRLAVDPALLMADASVTARGGVRYAAR